MNSERKRGVAKAVKCVEDCSKDLSRVSKCFIKCYLGNKLLESYQWIDMLKNIVEKVVDTYGLSIILFSREFKSFIEDPFNHLNKKLFIYTHDLARGKLSMETYAEKSMMAINTSLSTNMRILYQNWCILSILFNMYSEGVRIIYPEYNILSLERSGRQKLRWIPPNIVLDIPRNGCLSFYIEAPRPLAWGDTSDLVKTWSLYTALRPDLMVYGGAVYDILDLGKTPPIKKPDVIVEFKELPDWYKRVRDVKGPLAKPLSAEEWRIRWIEGLWDGLADALGVSRKEVIERVKEDKGVRLNEVKVVELYYSIYAPKEMILVSKHKIPQEIAVELESHNIIVVDDVGFDIEKLASVSNELLKHCVPAGEYVFKTSDRELAELIQLIIDLWEKNIVDRDKLRALLTYSMRSELENAV